MTHDAARRGFLRGIATLPLAGTLPAAAGPPDPTFAAVTAFQAAHDRWQGLSEAQDLAGLPDVDGDPANVAFEIRMDRLDALYVTQPTTAAGMVALIATFLDWDAEHLARGDGAHRGALSILRSAAALMAEVSL